MDNELRELRESQERYDLAMRALNEGVYDWDVLGGTIYYSRRVLHTLGMSPEAMRTPQDWRKRIHTDDLPRYDAAIVAHLKGETERLECDYRFRGTDGAWRWARQHGIAQRNASGRAVRLIGSTGDISDLKRAEEALREVQERYRLATEAATDGIYEWNVEDGSLYLSAKAKAFFSVAEGELNAEAWSALVHAEDLPGYRQAVIDHFRQMTACLEHEYRIAGRGGALRWVHDRGIALRDGAGRAVRLVGAITDVTSRREAEQALRQARDRAEAATLEKSKFLANMSHELRTPLNAIIGFSEVLVDGLFGELTAKQHEYVSDIHESGQHLLSLINDILDLSKVEAGRMELEISEFEVGTVLQRAVALVRERAQRQGVSLTFSVDSGCGEVKADERKLKQIMLNLLSNAIKFTPSGGSIAISARRENGSLAVAVRDTGSGIAPEDQAAVFEEFRQVGSDAQRKAEGTGLGLALTKRFVELHGGEIHLESTPGKGSTFTITLPVRP
jgi:PAS domain S-box-containing protein